MPEAPTAAIASGRAHRVPLVIGTMRDELGHAGWGPVRQFVNFLPTTPARVDRMFAATDPTAKERALAHYPDYPGAAALTRLAADCFFVRPTVGVAEAHARHAPTYLYRLDYAPVLLRLIGMGAIHATDVPMVFGCDMPAIQALTIIGRGGYRAMSERIQDSWAQFAYDGTPGWPAYDADQAVFVFDHPDSRVVPRLHSATWRAWRHYAGPQQADVAGSKSAQRPEPTSSD
ncbi:carboxylesterase family protein [Mycobacterium kansasii]